MLRTTSWTKLIANTHKLKTFSYHVRGLMQKPRKGYGLENTPLLRPPSVEEIKRKNLIPPGYEVIYINQHIKFLNIGNYVLIICFSAGLYSAYWLYKYSGDIETHHVEVLRGFLWCLVLYSVLMYIPITKSVRVVFKKDDQFKSLFYSVFGPFGKKYVDHTAQSIVKPKKDLFHYLQGKRIILHPDHFLDTSDYFELLKKTEEDLK